MVGVAVRLGRSGARPDGLTAPTTASASRTSPVDGGRLRVVPEACTDRPLNWPTLSARTSACVRIQTRCRLAGRVNAAPIGRPLCRSGIHTTHRARGFTGGGSDRVSRPDLVGDGRRATNGWRLVQHCCHRAAAWSSAGVLADGHARRAGRSRASRAAARAIRRLPRRAAPSTHLPIGTLTLN